MKTNVILILFMVACMVLNAYTATHAYFIGQTERMWFAIGSGVLCTIVFIGNLISLVDKVNGNFYL